MVDAADDRSSGASRWCRSASDALRRKRQRGSPWRGRLAGPLGSIFTSPGASRDRSLPRLTSAPERAPPIRSLAPAGHRRSPGGATKERESVWAPRRRNDQLTKYQRLRSLDRLRRPRTRSSMALHESLKTCELPKIRGSGDGGDERVAGCGI
jgi:hypothetical protein